MGDPVAEQMTAMLRYANYAKVARDLGVSRQTVMRWSRGEATTPWQLRRVRELFGVEAQQEAAPRDAERLRRIEGVVLAIAAATPGVKLELLEEMKARVDEQEESRRRPAAARRRAAQHSPGKPAT